jgi:hypothetical protein
MAITTVSGAASNSKRTTYFSKAVTAGSGGQSFTLWSRAGYPAAGSYDTTLNGVALTAPVTGQIPFPNPVSGNSYLARFQAQSQAVSDTVILADRLWHNGGFTITSTSAQSITSPTWPARDIAGSTNGDGVLLAVEVSATVGAATPTITVSYTNQSGTAGRTATNIFTTGSGASAGVMYPLSLQTGDTGVRSVQSLTLSASYVSGTINLVAYREIARLQLTPDGKSVAIDALTGGFPRMYDGSVPYMFLSTLAGAAARAMSGHVTIAQG